MEYLPKLIQFVCPDSKIAKVIKNSTAKAHAIIDQIIRKQNFDDIYEDLQKAMLSLIINESADLSTSKHICLNARLSKKNRIKDSFLALIPLQKADAVSLFDHIVNFFTKAKIPYKK